MKINEKILNKIVANLIEQYSEMIIHHDKIRFIPVMEVWYNICKSINMIHHIYKKYNNYMIILIGAEKSIY